MWIQSASSRELYDDYRRRRADRAKDDRAPGRNRRRHRTFPSLFVAFWKSLHGHHTTMGLALTTLSVATALNLLLPASSKIAIDYILTDNPGPAHIPPSLGLPTDRMSLLWLLSGAMVLIAGLSVSVGMWGRWQMTRLTKRMQARFRRRAYEHAMRLPLHRVYELKSGGASSLLRDDAGGAGELVFSMIYNPWRAIIQLIGTLAILTVVDWRMLLGALALIPAIWITHRTWIGRIRPIYRDIRMTRQAIDAHTTEDFSAMRVVRGFGRERGEAAYYVKRTHYMARQEILVWWWARAVDIAWQILIPLASAGVLLYGGSQVVKGTLTIGDVMMFSAYLLMLLSPLEALSSSAAAMQSSLAGFDRILDLLSEPVEFEGATEGAIVSPQRAPGRITLQGVSFAYPGAQSAVLHNIDLDAAPGEVIALVGPSGAGKTTLCNLIARFYDPVEGAVLLDGVDLRQINVASYRGLLGIVEQDVILFDAPISHNIGYARPGASMEQIVEAAKAAHAHEFIERLDYGYDTSIGERGVRLSGGQKQRIAIARAVLADPRLLILDEATSSLDSESEALIQRSLRRLMSGRTCFVIAHRLSTIRHADRIVVLEDGRITEIGSHEELLEADRRYAMLLRMQVSGERVAAADIL